MDHLSALLTRYGSETVVAATLRRVVQSRARSTVELVAVDVDEEQVGLLTTTQTANFLPLVQKAGLEGYSLVCRASIRGNALRADVALHARKAYEFNDDQLADLFAQ